MVLGADDQSVGWNIVSEEVVFNGVPEKRYPTKKNSVVPDTVLLILNMEEGSLAFKSIAEDFGVAFTGLKRVGQSFHVAAALGSPGDQVVLKYVGSIGKYFSVSYNVISNTDLNCPFRDKLPSKCFHQCIKSQWSHFSHIYICFLWGI